MEKTVESVRRGGKAVICGVNKGLFKVASHPLIVKEIDILGSLDEPAAGLPAYHRACQVGKG